MEARDEKILRHIGRYYLSLRVVIEREFFGPASCDNVLTRLRQQGLLLCRPRAFPGGISYYQISEQAAGQLGLPKYRARAPAGQALAEKLAVLWYCRMGEPRRELLEDAPLAEIFSGTVFPGPHCAESEGNAWRLFRVFVPSADDEYQLRQVREHLDRVTAGGHYDWLDCGAYGVAILTETETRRRKLLADIERKKLNDRAVIVVQVAPTPDTLREAIRHAAVSSADASAP